MGVPGAWGGGEEKKPKTKHALVPIFKYNLPYPVFCFWIVAIVTDTKEHIWTTLKL